MNCQGIVHNISSYAFLRYKQKFFCVSFNSLRMLPVEGRVSFGLLWTVKSCTCFILFYV